MAHNRVLFRSEARERILRDATQLASAVRITLGPRNSVVGGVAERRHRLRRGGQTSTWSKPGIVDQTKMVRIAVENAISVSSVLLLGGEQW